MNYRIKTTIASALAALALTAGAASAQGYDQLAAAAGLSPSEAAGMTRAQIAAHFHNRTLGSGEHQTVPRGSGVTVSSRGAETFARNLGLNPEEARGYTFEQLVAIHYNRGRSSSEQQAVEQAVSAYGLDHGQLIGAAGLSPDEARGMSLREIAAHFHNRSSDADERIPVRR